MSENVVKISSRGTLRRHLERLVIVTMVLFLVTAFMSVEMKIQSVQTPDFKAILGLLDRHAARLRSANLPHLSLSGPLAAVILPILASGVMAYLVWAGGAGFVIFLFVPMLLCGFLSLVFLMVGVNTAKGSTFAPTDTQTEMRSSSRLAVRLFVGRSCAIAALFLLLATLVCLTFPGRIGWAALDGAILALAFLLLFEAVRARGADGWFLDTALPNKLLRDRLAQATVAERFRIGWTVTGRCDGLRQAAMLHSEAPAETSALLRAQYAPAAVFVRPPFRRKTVMEEVMLRILGWRLSGLTAICGAAVALLLIVLLPSDMLARLRVLGDVFGLTPVQTASVPEPQVQEPKADQPPPPEDETEGTSGSPGQAGTGDNPSQAGSSGAVSSGARASGADGQSGASAQSGGKGQADQRGEGSNPGSDKAVGNNAGSSADSKSAGTGTADTGDAGEKLGAGSDGATPSGAGKTSGAGGDGANQGAAPNDAGSGTGEGQSAGAAASDQPKDAGQSGAAPQAASQSGTDSASNPAGGADPSTSAGAADAAEQHAGAAQQGMPMDQSAPEAQAEGSAEPSVNGAGQPGDVAPEGGGTAPAAASDAASGSEMAKPAGSGQPAAPNDGIAPSGAPGTDPQATASGGETAETAAPGDTGAGQDIGTGQDTGVGRSAAASGGADGMAAGDISPGEPAGGDLRPLDQPADPSLPIVRTDEPLEGAGEGQSFSTTDAAEPTSALMLDVAGRIGATAPEIGGQLELQAGGASQLFAEAGGVPDAVEARLPLQSDAPPPTATAPLPARQLLPAWISELVN